MDSSCPSCGGPWPSTQRYCLNCGHAANGALPELRTAIAAAPTASPARRPPGTRTRRLGMVGGMLLAGLAVGVLAGGLINPSTGVEAAPLIAVQMPAGAPAAAGTPGATSTHAVVAAGAPAAPPPQTAAQSNPPAPTTTTPAQVSSPAATTTTPTTTTPTHTPKHHHHHHHSSPSSKPSIRVKLPKIGHVWIVMLADQLSGTLFRPTSPAHYLNDTLVPQGTLLPNYYGTAHGALADGIALLSGQGPTPELQADCPVYEDLTPGSVDPSTGQAHGHGCVFPTTVSTLADQLVTNEFTWRAYIAGQGAPGDTTTTCRHPQTGVADPTATMTATSDGYVTRRNPFVYFESLLTQPACSAADVGLGQLGADLATNQVATLSLCSRPLHRGRAGRVPAGRRHDRRRRSGRIPVAVDPGDPGDQRVQEGRDDRNPVRPGARQRYRRRLERLLPQAQLSEHDQPGGPAVPGQGGGKVGRLSSRGSRPRARSTRRRRTTTPCCARSRTSSTSHTSGTRRSARRSGRRRSRASAVGNTQAQAQVRIRAVATARRSRVAAAAASRRRRDGTTADASTHQRATAPTDYLDQDPPLLRRGARGADALAVALGIRAGPRCRRGLDPNDAAATAQPILGMPASDIEVIGGSPGEASGEAWAQGTLGSVPANVSGQPVANAQVLLRYTDAAGSWQIVPVDNAQGNTISLSWIAQRSPRTDRWR